MASRQTFACYTMALLFAAAAVSAQLSTDFYDETCPNALDIIESAVRAAISKESRMGASLLRLHFHDCFVNASAIHKPPPDFLQPSTPLLFFSETGAIYLII
jgi:peroxidase